MWMARQADSTLLTPCPPGPLERVNWYLMSLGINREGKGHHGHHHQGDRAGVQTSFRFGLGDADHFMGLPPSI